MTKRVPLSPHIRSPRTTRGIMLDVCVALLAPAAAATYFFGRRVPLMVVIGIVTAVLSEWLWQLLRRRPLSVGDGSAVVTGFLMGLCLPVTAPAWTIVLGAAFAILVVKQWLGGGLGKNRFNPALTARVMLKIFFTPWITHWVLPLPDAVATATPLQMMSDAGNAWTPGLPGLADLFLGRNLGGNVGETSALAILIALVYLVLRGVVELKIPVLFVLSAVTVTGLWSGFDFRFMMTQMLSGTLLFGAVFMATDYSSGCLTPKGKTAFAVGGGVLTGLFRMLFDYPGGFGFAILIMNALAPYLDRKLAPEIYGRDARPRIRFRRQQR